MIERQYKKTDMVSLGGVPMRAGIAENLMRRLFWKQSDVLVTDEQCEEHAIRVVNLVACIGENLEHYSDVTRELRSLAGT